MNEDKLYRAWDIIYPVGIYYVITNITFFLIGLAVPYSSQNYGFMKVLSTLLTFPFIYKIYRMDEQRRGCGPIGYKKVWEDLRSEAAVLLGLALLGGCAAVVLNNLIAFTPLMKSSKTYQEVSEAFFGGTVFFEVLGPCILIPILEEYVFRGLVYQRLREWLNLSLSVLISSLIFGMMHMNIVQFVYAGILGILLAFSVERTKHLYGAVAVHMAANTVSVIRTETDWLSWMDRSDQLQVCTTAGLALIFFGISVLIFGKPLHSVKK